MYIAPFIVCLETILTAFNPNRLDLPVPLLLLGQNIMLDLFERVKENPQKEKNKENSPENDQSL